MWVDEKFDDLDGDCQSTLQQLRTLVDKVQVFTESEASVDFLRAISEEKVLVITSDAVGQDLIRRIHSMPQVNSIYIFCSNRDWYEPWVEEWAKIRGVFTQAESICKALHQSVTQCNQWRSPISFVTPNRDECDADLNQLEPSFMYTQLFKEILLEMEHDKDERKDLIAYCRQQEKDRPKQLELIDEFERDYCPDQAVLWYTRDCFTSEMLNRALRLLESDIIVKMGFFIRDLHRQIEQLHYEQTRQYSGRRFVVYRGQGLSTADLHTLKNTQGGLLSFNSFVSTSTDRDIAQFRAESCSQATDEVGILFVMTLDPTLASTPFADVEEHSYFDDSEGERLFSMHSVFRVDTVNGLDSNERLFEVQLTLTADDDSQLRRLKPKIAEEVEGSTGWKRIGRLLLKIGQLEKAEQPYIRLLRASNEDIDIAQYSHQLGAIKDLQGDHGAALSYYGNSEKIRQKTIPANHPDLANSYNNIGLVHYSMGDLDKALSYYKTCLHIKQNSLSANHPHLATCYNNIGSVYNSMKDFTNALSYYNRCLHIEQSSLPDNHPSLATCYNNIGSAYNSMQQFETALSYFKKCVNIEQRTLPAHHRSLATSFKNIGSAYNSMGEYPKALLYYERALAIDQKTLSSDHPDLATSYNIMGSVHKNMGEYAKALCYDPHDV